MTKLEYIIKNSNHFYIYQYETIQKPYASIENKSSNTKYFAQNIYFKNPRKEIIAYYSMIFDFLNQCDDNIHTQISKLSDNILSELINMNKFKKIFYNAKKDIDKLYFYFQIINSMQTKISDRDKNKISNYIENKYKIGLSLFNSYIANILKFKLKIYNILASNKFILTNDIRFINESFKDNIFGNHIYNFEKDTILFNIIKFSLVSY